MSVPGDVVDFRLDWYITEDLNDEYYGFRWSNMLDCKWKNLIIRSCGSKSGTVSTTILSTQGYQQRRADMTYILMLDENIDMLRLIMVRLRRRWSRKSDDHIKVNKSRMGVNEVIVPLDWALRVLD
ncbi:hypothetical protein Tco_1327753 [Tanacetum coccineum]